MCGLFAWNGNNSEFDWMKFNLLGLLNDSRGGDSCGRSFCNNRLIGVDKNKKYQELVKSYHNEDFKSNSILGHTRKASVGIINKDTAQPICLFDKDNDIVFHLIHNGTLLNYRELATNYRIDPKGKTDSQILAEIIYNDGYDVLRDYNGGAALVFNYTEDPNTIYVFKGASKTVENGAIETVERPLNYYQENDGSIYICSLDGPLEFIGGECGGDDPDVKEFNDNTVYTITNGKIVGLEKIDRSLNYQRKAAYTNAYGSSNHHGSTNYNTNNNGVNKDIEKDFVVESVLNICDKITFSKGRYWINKQFANGIQYINASGYVTPDKQKAGDSFLIFYFIRGVMLKDHESFQELSRLIPSTTNRHCSDRNIERNKNVASVLIGNSLYPIQLWDNATRQAGWIRNPRGLIIESTGMQGLFCGEFRPLFSTKTYIVTTGDVRDIETKPYLMPIFPTPKKEVEIDEDFEAQDEEIVKSEVIKILEDIDDIFQEAKNSIDIIGRTDTTTKALGAIESVQELLSDFTNELN